MNDNSNNNKISAGRYRDAGAKQRLWIVFTLSARAALARRLPAALGLSILSLGRSGRSLGGRPAG